VAVRASPRARDPNIFWPSGLISCTTAIITFIGSITSLRCWLVLLPPLGCELLVYHLVLRRRLARRPELLSRWLKPAGRIDGLDFNGLSLESVCISNTTDGGCPSISFSSASRRCSFLVLPADKIPKPRICS
jgi:hypothetical protein